MGVILICLAQLWGKILSWLGLAVFKRLNNASPGLVISAGNLFADGNKSPTRHHTGQSGAHKVVFVFFFLTNRVVRRGAVLSVIATMKS